VRVGVGEQWHVGHESAAVEADNLLVVRKNDPRGVNDDEVITVVDLNHGVFDEH